MKHMIRLRQYAVRDDMVMKCCIVLSPVADMDAKDEELRQVILRLWPLQAKKMLGLLMPPREGWISQNADCLRINYHFISIDLGLPIIKLVKINN
jgi:hypothetical protein